jgi:hypothetical protein
LRQGPVFIRSRHLLYRSHAYADRNSGRSPGRIFNGAAAALTGSRTHHELLLIQVGGMPRGLRQDGIEGSIISASKIVRRERTLSDVHMNFIWHEVETPSRIGSRRSGSSKQDNHNCEVDRLEIPRMGFQGKVVIVEEKRVAAARSRSPPLRHRSFSCPMKRVKPMEKYNSVTADRYFWKGRALL